MADDRMAMLDTVCKAIADGDVDFLCEGVRVLAQAVMEAEVTELTGVPKGARDPEARRDHRNGYRERRWDTRVGTIDLAVPRVRDGSYVPSLRLRRAARARPRAGVRRAAPDAGRPVPGQNGANRLPAVASHVCTSPRAKFGRSRVRTPVARSSWFTAFAAGPPKA